MSRLMFDGSTWESYCRRIGWEEKKSAVGDVVPTGPVTFRAHLWPQGHQPFIVQLRSQTEVWVLPY